MTGPAAVCIARIDPELARRSWERVRQLTRRVRSARQGALDSGAAHARSHLAVRIHRCS